MTFHLFEVSWEVCNKVGGIYTVVTSKARTLTERLGDRYLTLGPMLLDHDDSARAFEEEAGHDELKEACRARGVAVRVGRWHTGGDPRAILVGFADLYPRKDALLAGLWEDYRVDSLLGGWDYVEPVLFGHAAGIAIAEWHRLHVAPTGEQAVAQFHEWMTASGLLYLRKRLPEIGTIFTTHATMLGRALSATGQPPEAALAGRAPAVAARDVGVPAKHSMEGTAAREADVFTTVSSVTADEAQLLHGRRPEPILPNGLDLELIGALSRTPARGEVRAQLARLAGALAGEDVSDAAFLATSGRYEFHNKGLDVLLEAAARLERGAGRRLVVFLLVPGGSSGLLRDLRLRLAGEAPWDGPLGVTTHELFDRENDPIVRRCADLGLANKVGSRIKIVHVPAYLPAGAPLDLSYEATLAAMDLSAFPSFYEPWGYTPAESLAVGVPTITTDHAGFGVWARGEGVGPAGGVTVLTRARRSDGEVAEALALEIERQLASNRSGDEQRAACRAAAEKLAWSSLIRPYEDAFRVALRSGSERAARATPTFALPPTPAAPSATGTPHMRRFEVSALLPDSLSDLKRLARNLWWSWDPDAPKLFEAISPRNWQACGENPITFLRRAYPQDLARVASDASYLARMRAVMARFDAYCAVAPESHGDDAGTFLGPERPIAYFCFEFGIHPSLPIYSGGLGILAGDHLKSASDRNLPLVAVGLFYRGGYVRQHLTSAGEQLSMDVRNDPGELPLRAVVGPDGAPVRVGVRLPSGTLQLAAWEVAVGRVRLFLLDADLPENEPEQREITRRLYAGDQEQRLRQEVVLGRGGVRLLEALGIRPGALHMNEGHAGFAALERAAQLVRDEHLTFAEAREVVRAGTAFTTHTPVPAGHDVFPEDLLRRYFFDVPAWLGLPWEKFLRLGGATDGGGGGFNMTYLCLNLASFVNGVAEKHGEVSRALLHPFWSGLLEEEVPVTHVTNGVHLPTWTAREVSECLGVADRPPAELDFRRAPEVVDPARLWAARGKLRRALLEAARANLEEAYRRRQDDPKLLGRVREGLDVDDALVIGFARRFAPYKRATLLLEDEERLARLVGDPDRPVRVLFAGKAHPADGAGADLVRRVAELTRRDPFVGKVVFLEDYDIGLAKRLVQGADVWLNNPIPPLEASGTSGMKAAANGALNLSVLDGWWIEGCDGRNGWGIDPEPTFHEQRQQNRLDNEQILRLLEDEVVPLFFERDAAGVPRAWLERSIHALSTVAPFFSTGRMVEEYARRAYVPCAAAARDASLDGFAQARARSAEQQRLRKGFEEVTIVGARIGDISSLHTGDPVHVRLEVRLGPLTPADLVAELVLGRPKNGAEALTRTQLVELAPGAQKDGVCTFSGTHHLGSSGTYGWGVRVRPRPGRDGDLELRGLVRWA